MSNFAIVVPISTGLIAAIIFFIFEVFLFPLIFYATSRMAALSLQRHAEKGQPVRVKSIPFPMWTEGLLAGHRTHWVLFIFRIVLIVISVYLETRLRTEELSRFDTFILPHVFEVNRRADLLTYENYSDEKIWNLRRDAELVARTCMTYHGDGWVTASDANVSYDKNENLVDFNCMDWTERRIYKRYVINESKDIVSIFEYFFFLAHNSALHKMLHSGDLTFQANVSFGTLDAYPASDTFPINRLETPRSKPCYRIENVSLLNSNKTVQCFGPRSLEPLPYRHNRFVHLLFMCNNYTSDGVMFWTVNHYKADLLLQITIPVRNGTLQYASLNFSASSIYVVAHINFSGPPLFTAEHFVTYTIWPNPLPVDEFSFNPLVQRLMYTRKDNRSTNLRLDSKKQVTVLDSVFLSVIISEIIIIAFGGIVMLLISKYYLRIEEIPTTLDGLSHCWVHQDPDIPIRDDKFVSLILAHQLRPGKRHCKRQYIEDYNGSIFNFRGTGIPI